MLFRNRQRSVLVHLNTLRRHLNSSESISFTQLSVPHISPPCKAAPLTFTTYIFLLKSHGTVSHRAATSPIWELASSILCITARLCSWNLLSFSKTTPRYFIADFTSSLPSHRVQHDLISRAPAQLQAFQFANAEILRNAKAGNLEAATMGFQQLTISCVSCHKMLRNID